MGENLVQTILGSPQKATTGGLPHLGGWFFSFPTVSQRPARISPYLTRPRPPGGSFDPRALFFGGCAESVSCVRSCRWKFRGNVRVRSELKDQHVTMDR